ncbi:MAG: ParB/RepB/Spo0J family partition protein [Planctomycetota bacterium]
MSKERRLGRGLEALLGQIPSRSAAPAEDPYGSGESLYGESTSPARSAAAPEAAPEPAAVVPPPPLASVEPPTGLARISIHEITSNPAQPRQEFDADELHALSESINAHGLLQPIVVRRVQDRYELIAGERRLRAAQDAGMADVPANIIEADERASAELAIVENLHRKDLGALEKAASFARYLEEYRCTQEELASRLKLDRSTIANLIRLLELPEAVQDSLRQGRITQGHARALLPLGEEREQIAFCQRIERESLSVRDTEAMVQAAIDEADAEPLAVVDREGNRRRPGRPQNEHLAALEQEFRAALGMKVKITHNARGRGKLTIQFRNHEEFERLRAYICDGGDPIRGQVG